MADRAPRRGSWVSERASAIASWIGESPRASTEVRCPLATSSMAPRAMVREPSLRISTTSRATTGGSPTSSSGGVFTSSALSRSLTRTA